MSNNSLEIVHEGWLIKSPPTKPIWRARWRRRWFVLRHSGELPGQYFLEYYTDRNCRKLKGKIDLDQCEQVDAGLKFENRKQKYQYLFDVRTPKRTFYLAAESEKDMNKWVDCVCHVCGLKAYSHEDDYYGYMPAAEDIQSGAQPLANHHDQTAEASPSPVPSRGTSSSASVSLSGPYIPISECISGRPLNGNSLVQLKLCGDAFASEMNTLHHNSIPNWRRNGRDRVAPHTLPRPCHVSSKNAPPSNAPGPLDLPGEFYDMPRRLHLPNLEGIDQQSGQGTPPLHSPATTMGGTDGESAILTEEDEWVGNGHVVSAVSGLHGPPNVNWNTYPRDGDALHPNEIKDRTSADWNGEDMTLKFARRYGKLTISDENSAHPPVAPPRPPKPLHLMEAASKHSYLNLENVSPKYGPDAIESIRSSDSEPSPGIFRPGSVNPNSPNHLSTVIVSDETYDFPRSHQHGESGREPRHCYTNAAPGRPNDVFRYDFHNDDHKDLDEGLVPAEEPTSPRSESSSLASSTVIYSNLPSPLCGPGQVPPETSGDSNSVVVYAPPVVNRGLKPGRKHSDSNSHDLSPGAFSPTPVAPPMVDRTLKPYKKVQDVPLPDSGPLELSSPPACQASDGRSWRKPRAAPSPTPLPPASAPSTLRAGRCQSTNSISDEDNFSFLRGFAEDEVVYFMENHKNQFYPAKSCHKSFETIQYLDLDHPESSVLQQAVPKSPDRSQASGIVYKTVDFVKTEAFKRTKQEVEEKRKEGPVHDL